MKNSDKILTFSAIFISCLALIVSIVQTRLLQKQSQAAVWPHMQLLTSFGEDYYKLNVVNQGIGPAIISEIEYNYQDTSFYSIVELVKFIVKEDKTNANSKSINLNMGYAEILKGRVIKSSESLKIFDAKDTTSVRIAFKYFENLDIKIDYCSIYEKCWRLEKDNTIEL